jgi:outer membrane protein assembly factor BamB
MFRSCRSIFSAALCFAAVLVFESPRGVAEDWPRWGGPRGDSTWRGPKLADKWSAEGLPVVWKKPIGGGYGGVSVVAGKVFVQDRLTESREVERLLCFDARSGNLLWQHADDVAYGKLDYGNGPRAQPTVHDGQVHTLGALGRLCCVESETGRLVWTKDLVADFGAVIPTWGLAASPLVWKDLVIVHAGAANGGCVIAFNRLTGAEVWRSGNDPAGYATPVVIDAPSGPQLVCWSPENVLGIDPDTGKPLWSIPYKVTYGVSISPPIYYENTLFVTGYWEGSKAIRLGEKPDEAKLVWEENRFLRALMAQPLYRDGLVYMIDKTHGLTSFVLASGEKLWDDKHQSTPRGRNPHASLVWLEDGDRAILLNELGDLILARLNREGYHELARANIIERKENSPIWAHPAYAGKYVFARSDSEIVCVELPVREAVDRQASDENRSGLRDDQ